MKKFLLLIGSIFLTTSGITSFTYQSNHSTSNIKPTDNGTSVTKINLNTITTLSGLVTITAKTNLPYSKFTKSLINTANAFKDNNLAGRFQLNWYNDLQRTTLLNNWYQAPTTVYVQITADPRDSYWEGTSTLLPLTMIGTKVNLNTITTLSQLPVIGGDFNYRYQDINKEIYNKAPELAIHPLNPFFIVDYFSDSAGKNNINGALQRARTIYIKIDAASTDVYWTGASKTFPVTVKRDISTLNSLLPNWLTNVNPRVETTTYINFAYHYYPDCFWEPWVRNFNYDSGFHQHFYKDAAGTINIDNEAQAPGTVYVIITISPNDPNWMGISRPLAIQFGLS